MAQQNSFGGYLRQLRKRLGMTQRDLAAAVGYSVSLISALERNQRLPTLPAIAKHFVPALGLTNEPQLVEQLLTLAAQERGEAVPSAVLTEQIARWRNALLTPPGVQLAAHPPSAVAAASLPMPPTALIGRDDELQRLGSRLLGHGGRLLTLIGPPGVGKSRLGLALATQLQPFYRAGSQLIKLAAIDDPQLVAGEMLIQLGLHNRAAKSPLRQLIEALRHKALLLLLDNFEQLIDPPGPLPVDAPPDRLSAPLLVATLLAECPELTIIVTSRERLHLRAEQRHYVQPLAPAAAVTLFIERATAVAPPALSHRLEPAQVESICRQLDCLPLAIELAAARLDLMTPTALLAELSVHRLDLLSDGAVDLPPQQRTLRRAIHGSYGLLGAAEQRLFCRLGLYVGGFDWAALRACGATDLAVAQLLNKSLIYAMPQQDEPRFALLETVRAFALEQLTASAEAVAARHQHAAYFCRLAQQIGGQLRGLGKARGLEQLEREHENFRAVLQWATSDEPALALSLALALEEFWSVRGYDREAVRWLQAALARCPTPTPDRIHGLLALANLQRRLGASTQAEAQLAAVANLLNSFPEHAPIRLKFYRYCGWHHYDQHDYAQTVQSFQAGLALARHLAEPSAIVQFLAALAYVQQYQPACHDQRIAYLDEALLLLDGLDEPETLAFVLQQYGGLEVADAHYAAAAQHYERVLVIYRQLGNKLGLAWGLALVGEVAWFQGEWLTAAAHHAEAHRLFVELENLDGIMTALHHLGQCARQQGQLHRATAFYVQSLQLAEQLNNRHLLARTLAGLGGVALAQADRTRAALLIGAAHQIFATLPPFLAPPDQQAFLALVAALRAGGMAPTVAAAWAEGEKLDITRIVALVRLFADESLR